MIIVHATVPVRPEKRDEFTAVFAPLVEASRQEAGNLGYTLYESVEQPGEYLVVEQWESMEALRAHFEAEHFTAAGARFPDFVTGPADVVTFESPGPQPLSR